MPCKHSDHGLCYENLEIASQVNGRCANQANCPVYEAKIECLMCNDTGYVGTSGLIGCRICDCKSGKSKLSMHTNMITSGLDLKLQQALGVEDTENECW